MKSRTLLLGLTLSALASAAQANSFVDALATNATSPLPASSCLYIDQFSGAAFGDAKLCSGYAAAFGALTASSNLSDLPSAATARTNLGLGTAALVNTGTSAGAVPLLNGTNTWGGVQSFVDGDISLLGSTSGFTVLHATAIAGSGSLTFPAGTANILSDSSTAIVSNKTISGSNNALTVRLGLDTSGTLPITFGGTGVGTLPTGVLLGAGTGSITAVPEVNGDCLVGSGGVWTTGACTGTGGLSNTLTSAHVFVGNGSNVATDAALTGVIAITNAGLTSLTANAVTTAAITNAAVTYAKIQNATAHVLLGNPTASGAAPSEITLGAGLAFSGTTLTATGSGGNFTVSGAGTTGDLMTMTGVTSGIDSGVLLTSLAPLASPTLTGTPAAPTAATGTNTTQLATTAFVKNQAYATLASPALSGIPTAPAPSQGTNSTQLATTAFVKLQQFPIGLSWSAGINPTTVPSYIVGQAMTIQQILARVETVVGSAATVDVWKTPSGTACGSVGGTKLNTVTLNANTGGTTVVPLGVNSSSLSPNDTVCLVTSGTSDWTSGAGIGNITVLATPS